MANPALGHEHVQEIEHANAKAITKDGWLCWRKNMIFVLFFVVLTLLSVCVLFCHFHDLVIIGSVARPVLH